MTGLDCCRSLGRYLSSKSGTWFVKHVQSSRVSSCILAPCFRVSSRTEAARSAALCSDREESAICRQHGNISPVPNDMCAVATAICPASHHLQGQQTHYSGLREPRNRRQRREKTLLLSVIFILLFLVQFSLILFVFRLPLFLSWHPLPLLFKTAIPLLSPLAAF